ncbi:hypothetical protein GA0115254_108895 [Streptomyces sp. Ncost-T10-10d]|nr:hypothetical protein GA0115254_108895 [Streptomyces sp. Ncost-T10-10d]
MCSAPALPPSAREHGTSPCRTGPRAREERRTRQDLERKIAGEGWSQEPDKDPISSSERGGLIDPAGFSRSFNALVKRSRVRRITVRLAQHTCGTLPAFLKVHPKVALEDLLIG